jgi:hypothetical protein
MKRRTFGCRASLSSSYELRMAFGVIAFDDSASIFTISNVSTFCGFLSSRTSKSSCLHVEDDLAGFSCR